MSIKRRGRYWALFDNNEELICLAVYKKGAVEVARRLDLEQGIQNNDGKRGKQSAQDVTENNANKGYLYSSSGYYNRHAK